MKKLFLVFGLLILGNVFCDAVSQKYKIITSTKTGNYGYRVVGSQKYEICADTSSAAIITLSSDTVNFGGLLLQGATIPAANISAGSLGVSVNASSVAVGAVGPEQVQPGNYFNNVKVSSAIYADSAANISDIEITVSTITGLGGNSVNVINDINVNRYMISGTTVMAATGSTNIMVGHQAGGSLVGGVDNTLIGKQAGKLTTGSRNTDGGAEAGIARTSGSNNTNLGYKAGRENIIGNGNVNLGASAGRDNTGTGNINIGYASGYSETSGNYKLRIGNADLGTHNLIDGEMDNNLVRFSSGTVSVQNGNLYINNVATITSVGAIYTSSDVYADKFHGDGSLLTGLAGGGDMTTAVYDADTDNKVDMAEGLAPGNYYDDVSVSSCIYALNGGGTGGEFMVSPSTGIIDGTLAAGVVAQSLAAGSYMNDISVSSAGYATSAAIGSGNYFNDVKVSSAIYADSAGTAASATDTETLDTLDSTAFAQLAGSPIFTGGVVAPYVTATSSMEITGQSFKVSNATFTIKEGKIGIGTESPSYKLHVMGSPEEILAYFTDVTNGGIGLGFYEDGIFIKADSGKVINIMDGNDKNIIVYPDGTVGFGVAPTGVRMEVLPYNGIGMRILDPGTRNTSMSFGVNSSSDSVLYFCNHAFNKVSAIHSYGNSYLMGGNLGIGTDSPTEKVHSSNNIRAAFGLIGSSAVISGDVTAGSFTGNGAALTSLTAANISAGNYFNDVKVSSAIYADSAGTAASATSATTATALTTDSHGVCISSPFTLGAVATRISNFYPYAVTITTITAKCTGGTNVVCNIEQRAYATAGTVGTDIWGSNVTVTTTPWIGGTASDFTIPANTALYLLVDSLSGNVDRIEVEWTYTKD
jgi:hypothetical protein